jgi:hypothetical protein
MNYSSVAKVAGLVADAVINVYPNPIVDRIIRLQYDQFPAGMAQVALFNAAGQQVHSAMVAVGTSGKLVIQPSSLAAGKYNLQIIASDGKRLTVAVLVK